MLSVPDGKDVGVVVLVLLFKTSKMLTLPAKPDGPELALPPQDASPTQMAQRMDKTHGVRFVHCPKKINILFICFIFSFYCENKSDLSDFLTEL